MNEYIDNESIDIVATARLSNRTTLHIVEVDGKRLASAESCSKYAGDSCDHVSCSIVQIKD